MNSVGIIQNARDTLYRIREHMFTIMPDPDKSYETNSESGLNDEIDEHDNDIDYSFTYEEWNELYSEIDWALFDLKSIIFRINAHNSNHPKPWTLILIKLSEKEMECNYTARFFPHLIDNENNPINFWAIVYEVNESFRRDGIYLNVIVPPVNASFEDQAGWMIKERLKSEIIEIGPTFINMDEAKAACLKINKEQLGIYM